jgi:hypothetical protein
MISMNYINGDIDLKSTYRSLTFESVLDNINNESADAYGSFVAAESKCELESDIFDTVTEETLAVYQEAGKNLIEKLGEQVLKILSAFKDFIAGIADKIRSIGFGSKTDIQKAQKLIEKYPEFEDEIRVSFEKGQLSLADVRTLGELDKTFDNLIKGLANGSIDTDKATGKMKKAVKNFNLEATAGAAVATIGVGTAVFRLFNEASKFNQNGKAGNLGKFANFIYNFTKTKSNESAPKIFKVKNGKINLRNPAKESANDTSAGDTYTESKLSDYWTKDHKQVTDVAKDVKKVEKKVKKYAGEANAEVARCMVQLYNELVKVHQKAAEARYQIINKISKTIHEFVKKHEDKLKDK